MICGVTYEVWLLAKADMLCRTLNNIAEDEALHHDFISKIDCWDWEVESLLEGFLQLKGEAKLSISAKSRVSIRVKNYESSSIQKSKKRVLDSWNNAITKSSTSYCNMTEKELESLGLLVSLDFDLYLK